MLKLLKQELDSGVDAAAECMQELYRSMVRKEHCRRQYRRFFDVFLRREEGAALRNGSAAMPQRIRRTGDQKIARRCRLGAAAPGANGAHPFCNISAAPFP